MKIGCLNIATPSTVSNQRWFAWVVAATYSVALASLPVDVFMDRINYLNYATDSWAILLQRWNEGWVVLAANEPLWLLFNAFLSTFLQPEEVVRAVILVSSGVVAWIVARQFASSPWKVVLILLLPIVIRYHVIALRNGLALAVFLAGWVAPNGVRRWLLLLLAPLIHVSYFIVLALLATAWLCLRWRFAPDLRALTFVVFSLSLAVATDTLASMAGARHAYEYAFSAVDVSGLGFLFWMGVLVVMWFEGRTFLRQNAFETGSIVFYLVSVWLVDFAARAFESTSLFILLAGMRLTGWRLSVFAGLLTIYMVLYVVMNINKPWLGFGF